ncbi:FKBP-type 22 kDa peptidyl-prolyl cis-trans isomerase [bioreactor metagenome]|uniref:peptidylprolyl isomerase n=1 Tax=bioreactor metagenome TaxID=1076179 RepID=A0A645HW32_9ZZZZ
MQEKTKKYEERKKTALEDGKKFLEANKKKSGVTVEKSGMQYRVITAGKGAVPKPDDVIKFHIVGKFIDGEEFQSTKTMGTPPEATLNQINIKGIHEALSKMPIGSVWEVVLPYELAYGEQDTGVIPPKSAVIFELELLEIVKPEAPQSKKK